MQYRELGSLSVSCVGVGCNQFGVTCDGRATARIVAAALDSGINFFDTADEYGGGASEELLGRALRRRRSEAVIATKVGCVMPSDPDSGGAGPAWIARAVDASLRRLQTEHIDLYQVHYPDPVAPIEETMGALNDLVRAGKVREIGCANFTAAMIAEAVAAARDRGLAPFASTQTHLNVIRQRALAEVVPACEHNEVKVLPYWPLASGLLTGKYRRGAAPALGTRMDKYPVAAERMLIERNFARIEKLASFAGELGHSLLELAIAWLLAMPAVASVIAGATAASQVRGNAAAGQELWLSPETFARASALGGA